MPAFEPAFMPLMMTSGGSGSSSSRASLTQSAGRPSTAQPMNDLLPSNSSKTSLTRSGVSSVTECPDGALLRGRGDDRDAAEGEEFLAKRS